MFNRPHHQRIAKLLRAFNSDLLQEAQCYFGGGTAIVLSLGEYRESVDVDFLCTSKEGYRSLRNTITQRTLGSLLREPLLHLREVRVDRDAIRTVLEIDEKPIKVEFISEGHLDIQGAFHPVFRVPTLSREDMYATKLLANTDRGYDRSALSRDMIDLAMMINHWGSIPARSWEKAREAYGESVDKAYRGAIEMIDDDRDYLKSCLYNMRMDEALLDRIPVILGCTAPYDYGNYSKMKF